jgi:ApaG protein
MYELETEGIIVRVAPEFLPHESEPTDHRFIWAYTVEIENRSPRRVQLVARYWRITEMSGLTHEVQGDGVVGKQPSIDPGDTFEYTSACPLSSPSGLMGGYYEMRDLESDVGFVVTVPTFALDSPHGARLAN